MVPMRANQAAFTLEMALLKERILNSRSSGVVGIVLCRQRLTLAVRQGGPSASSTPQNGEPALACTALVGRSHGAFLRLGGRACNHETKAATH
jgi:hypothetical protein